MQTHAIVELEDGAMNVVVGGREGGTVRVLRSLRLPMQDLTKEGVTNVLRQVGSDALQGALGVHVVLGERRTQHFVSKTPQMSASDTLALIMREALRATNLQNTNDVLVAARLIGRHGGKTVVGATALPRAVWQPLADAFGANSIDVLSLHSMETCLAMAAPVGPAPSAIVEVNSGRARFVFAENQCPVQVRRFLIGGGAENNSSAMTTQLAMELPRTFDWLRELGVTLPRTLLLGTRVALAPDEVEMLRGDELDTISPAEVKVVTAEDQITPSLSVLMLLQHLADGTAPPSLLVAPSLRMPWGAGRWLGLAAATVAGFACSFSAVVDGGAWFQRREELSAAQAKAQQVEASVRAREAEAAAARTAGPVADGRLTAALGLRRPTSRLVADVNNAAGAGVSIDELRFASTDRVLVTGVVEGGSRKEALANMAAFARQVHRLAYLTADSQDEIVEVAGARNRFRFRLTLAWRI